MNWCFWIVVLAKTLESLLDFQSISQSILKKISPEYSLAGLMLKLQQCGCMMWRTDALEKMFESPLDSREIKPVNPTWFEINPEYSLAGLMLKLQFVGHLMRRADSLEKILMLRKIEGRKKRGHRGWDGWMASLSQWTWVWANSMGWWRTGKPGACSPWGHEEMDTT